MRTLPPVSEPRAKSTALEATAQAEPEEEPPQRRGGEEGLFVVVVGIVFFVRRVLLFFEGERKRRGKEKERLSSSASSRNKRKLTRRSQRPGSEVPGRRSGHPSERRPARSLCRARLGLRRRRPARRRPEQWRSREMNDNPEFSFLHLLYAGEPNAGSCPATSYISLLANVRPDRGRLEEAGGARTAGGDSELQHAEGALALTPFARSIASSSSFEDVIWAAAAKLPPLAIWRYPRATAAARRGRERGQGSVVATIQVRVPVNFFFLRQV